MNILTIKEGKKFMVAFNHLHVHSSIGSMADSMVSVSQLFNRAKELTMSALAITDHGTIAAAYDARKESLKTGVKYCPGIEAYFVNDLDDESEKRKHLVLIAKNEIGYKNLLSLNYEGFKNSQYVAILNKVFPRIDWNLLEQYKEGLVCLTACSNGPVGKLLFASDNIEENEQAAMKTINKLNSIFGDDLYLEVQPHTLRLLKFDRKTGQQVIINGKPEIISDQAVINNFLVKAAKETGIKLVATCDTHYLDKSDAKYHDMLSAILDKRPLNDPTRHKYEVDEFYFKSGQEIYSFFNQHYGDLIAKQVCRNSIEITDKCQDPTYLDTKGHRFPRFDPSDDKDYTDFLKWKESLANKDLPEDHLFLRFKILRAFKKLKLSSEIKKIYKDRIQKEIQVLEGHNFCSYILIVSDFIKQARQKGIRIGPGRGSVAGSLVAYLLRIHDVNPMEYDLLFERFHNKEKKAFPDIDTDIEPSGRMWIEEYLNNKYGVKNVAHVSNLSTMTPKVTIKDIARSLEIGGSKSDAFKIANAITDTIPAEAKTIDEALELSKEFRAYCDKYPELEDYGRKLVGLEKTYATHAAGVVIGDTDLTTLVPLRIDKEGMVAVQYEKNRCEDVGLIKMDLLGLEHLGLISNIIKNAKSLGHNCPEPKDIPLDDPDVWADISSGRTLGVFQMGSKHMIDLCRRIKPKSIEELSLVNALGRPSAAKSRDVYISRRDGKEKVVFKDKCLEAALGRTLGVGVYEEQLMFLAHTVAGWDLNKADGLRKLTKLKGKNPELAERLKLDFIESAVKTSDISVNMAEEIWIDVIEPFAGYGFNKSHSIAYSINGYHTAYYKHYFPAAFMAALLQSEVNSNSQDRDDNIKVYKKEAKRLGLSIVVPDINRSGEVYDVVDDKTIIMGLTAIKGVGATAVKSILQARQEHAFKSFADFLFRTESSKVRKDSIQALASAGAFDSLGITRKSAYTYYQEMRKKINKYVEPNIEKGIAAIYCTSGFEFNRVDFNEEWPRKELLMAENNVLGEYVSGGIQEVYENFFTPSGVAFNKLKGLPDKMKVKIEAIVTDVIPNKFRAGKNKGKTYARCTITDINSDATTLTVWNENYNRYRDVLKAGQTINAICLINEWNGVKSLVLMDIV